MSTAVILVVVVVGLGSTTFARRLPFPFAELTVLAVIALLLTIGIVDERPALVAVAGLVPLPIFGFSIPFISDGGGRRPDDLGFAGAAAKVSEPARTVRGVFASRWPRGELELTGNLLHFVADDGDETFRVRIDEIDDVRFRSSGRAQLTIRTTGGERHSVSFGRNGLGRGEVGAAITFWRETIRARQSNPAP